nr:N-acetyltransferase [uncultured bacterium]
MKAMSRILPAYFKRIGYNGKPHPTLSVLKELHLLHPASIPFENLNPLLGIPVKLDSGSLQQKLIDDGRGGYCFEQNLLFKEVLEAIGFRVKGLAARIMWNRPKDEITSRGHMLLLVEADGKPFIADAGFGGLGPTAPLLLQPGLVQETPHEQYKLRQDGSDYILYSDVKEEWKPLYRFNLEEHYRQDYEITNWYLSNHPESHFVTGLYAARAQINPNRRYALHDNELSIHAIGEESKKRVLKSPAEIRQVLEELFHIRLPELPGLNEKLKELL